MSSDKFVFFCTDDRIAFYLSGATDPRNRTETSSPSARKAVCDNLIVLRSVHIIIPVWKYSCLNIQPILIRIRTKISLHTKRVPF